MTDKASWTELRCLMTCPVSMGSSAKTTLLACNAGIGKFHYPSVSVEFISFTEYVLVAQNGLKSLTGLLLRYCVYGYSIDSVRIASSTWEGFLSPSRIHLTLRELT